jgi:hypothetical protein
MFWIIRRDRNTPASSRVLQQHQDLQTRTKRTAKFLTHPLKRKLCFKIQKWWNILQLYYLKSFTFFFFNKFYINIQKETYILTHNAKYHSLSSRRFPINVNWVSQCRHRILYRNIGSIRFWSGNNFKCVPENSWLALPYPPHCNCIMDMTINQFSCNVIMLSKTYKT